jgi:hypothetical protein
MRPSRAPLGPVSHGLHEGECEACADEGSDAEAMWTVECGRRGPDGQAVSVWMRVGYDAGTREDAEAAAVELAAEDAEAAELDEYVTLYEYRVKAVEVQS